MGGGRRPGAPHTPLLHSHASNLSTSAQKGPPGISQPPPRVRSVVRLEKQLKAHEQANQLLDSNWIEDLIKNYQEILRKFMKLDEKYRTLEKRDGRQQYEKGERFAATREDNTPQDTSVHFQEKNNSWGGDQADSGQRERNFAENDQSTGMSGIRPGSSRPPSATTVVIVGGNTVEAAPSNSSRRATMHETIPADQPPANQENLQNVHLEGSISMIHRHERPASNNRGVGLSDSAVQCNNFTEEEFETRLRRSYSLYEERLAQVRAEYDHVVGEYKRENMKRKNREEELLEEREALNRQLDEMQRMLNREGDARQELVNAKLQVEELTRALARVEESRDRHNQAEATPLTVEHLQSVLEQLNVGDSVAQRKPGTSGSLGQVASSTRNCLQTVRQMIEDCLNRWQSIVLQQQTEGATAQLGHLRARCDALTDENRSLTSKLNTEQMTAESLVKEGRDFQRKISELELTCCELRQKERDVTERLREATLSNSLQQETQLTAVDQLRRQLQAAQDEVTDAAGQRQRLEQHVDGLNRTTADLKKQLEERIAENCRLHTDLEKRADDLAKTADASRRLERELNEVSATSQTRICELQSELRSENERQTKAESLIRQLKLDQDQMRIRNETFQMQLAAITSTYNHMFAATTTDASD